MIYENLGRTDIQVSKICLGTMNFGEQNSEQEAHEQLDYALSQGINFIDTAEIYAIPPKASTQGLTEKYIGTWLARRRKRSDVILATKIVGPGDHITWLRSPLNFNAASIKEALEGSLTRLQTDYIDLYQLHWPERKTNFFGKLGYEHQSDDPWKDNFQEILSCLKDLIKEGKIRQIGLSNETPWAVMHTLQLSNQHELPRIASVQNPYNLLNRSYEVGPGRDLSMREQTESDWPIHRWHLALLIRQIPSEKRDTPR